MIEWITYLTLDEIMEFLSLIQIRLATARLIQLYGLLIQSRRRMDHLNH